jgi:integrase
VVGLTPTTEAALEEERYVFGDGAIPLDGDNFRKRVWEPLCMVAKVGKVRIHDLRHGYASQLIAAGKPIHYVQQQCGHHSPAFTMAEYGHLFPEDQHGNVDVLDDVDAPEPHAQTHTGATSRGFVLPKKQKARKSQ